MRLINNSKCEGNADLTNITSSSQGSARCYGISWHPTSNYFVATGAAANKQIIVYSFDGTTLSEVEVINAGNSTYLSSWHPNGDYLAVSGLAGNWVKVYSWNGTDTLTEVESVDLGYDTRGVVWHPDGDYLAVAHLVGGTDELTIFSWNGTDTLTPVETVDYAGNATFLAWSHDGDHLCVGNENNVIVYSWNGTDTLTSVATYDYGSGNYTLSISWSLSDAYIFVGGLHPTKQIVVLSFNGSALSEVTTINLADSNTRAAASLSRGGNYLFVSIYHATTRSNYAWFRAYVWDETAETLSLKDSISLDNYGSLINSLSHNNKFYAYTSSYNATYDTTYLRVGTSVLRRSTRNYCIT